MLARNWTNRCNYHSRDYHSITNYNYTLYYHAKHYYIADVFKLQPNNIYYLLANHP